MCRLRAARRGVWLAVLVLAPSLLPATPVAAGDATPLTSESWPPEAWAAVAPWLLHEHARVPDGLTGAALLASLGVPEVAAPPVPGDAGWEAYFAAMRLTPTAQERAALDSFRASSPHLATLVAAAAADVGRAQAMRDQALAALTPDDWRALPSAVAHLAAGHPERMTSAQARAVSLVDVDLLAQAALVLARSAERLQQNAPAALARDAALAQALPPGLREAALAGDPAGALAAIAPGAAPVVADVTLREAVLALQALAGDAAAAPALDLLPRELQAALVNVLAAQSRAAGDPAAGDALLATLAAELPRLARGAYNLSLSTEGERALLAGSPRPLQRLSSQGTSQPLLVLEDALGPVAAPPAASLREGYQSLALALGRDVDAATLARLDEVAAGLPEGMAPAVGSLLQAMADYQRDLAPGAPAPAEAARTRAAARPLLASDAPLSTGDMDALRRSLAAERALRDLVAARSGAILGASDALRGLGTMPMAAGVQGQDGVLFDDGDGILLVLDAEDSVADMDRFPRAYALVLDLGGNETYRMLMAGVDGAATPSVPPEPETLRVSVAIDLGGADTYEAVRPYTLGAARGSPEAPAFALLHDVTGNDVYRGEREVFGWGNDSIGILLDGAGSDDYAANASGLAGANSTDSTSIAVGVLVDSGGVDSYRTGRGFAALDDRSQSFVATAVFLDLAGDDRYLGDCPRDPREPCFSHPRRLGGPPGVTVFLDAGGANTYPRDETDPAGPGSSLAVGIGRFALAYDYSRYGIPISLPGDDGSNRDSDGDLLPDSAEELLGLDPRQAPSTADLDDSDGDGYPNVVEGVMGTDPADPTSYPVGLPSGVDPVGGVLEGFPLTGSNLLVDVPGLLAIGLPGPNAYDRYYPLLVDLGFGEEDADAYLNATAYAGVAIDLGGDDRYEPRAVGGVMPGAFASLGGAPAGLFTARSSLLQSFSLAALVDLGGDDRFLAEAGSGASMRSPFEGTVVFLDAAGNDRHAAPLGASHAYVAGPGRAFFLELGGDDQYVAPTQGYVDVLPTLSFLSIDGVGSPGTDDPPQAVFLDVSGADLYDGGPTELLPAQFDQQQGYARDRAGTFRPGTTPTAAFLDLGGADTHRVRDLTQGEAVDVSATRGDRMRLDPVDSGAGGAILLFLDVDLGDTDSPSGSDGDAMPDAVEVAAGTDAQDGDDSVALEGHFLLKLPRLGLAVGAQQTTLYAPDLDLALLVDVGGDDVYANRAGATTPRFGASLAVDLGGSDLYEFSGGANLSKFSAFHLSNLNQSSIDALPDPAADRAYADVAYAGAQGAGILGVGVLHDVGGSDRFRVELQHAGCRTCLIPGVAVGASQGAGILGVGLLVHADPMPDSLAAVEMSVSVNATGNATMGVITRTASQGAGLQGIGLLARESARGADLYELFATGTGGGPVDAATSGQGYAAGGVGILYDAGGANVFRADSLAQGVAEAGSARNETRGPVPFPVFMSLPFPLASGFGALLLPGVGDDALSARERAQGFGTGGGVGLLYDAEGDDLRTLEPTGTRPALGQGAGTLLGAGVLLDGRGNDAYHVRGVRGQGIAVDGVGVLVDLAGADEYVAWSEAQGHVAMAEMEIAVQVGATPRTAQTGLANFALLLDRTGNDLYKLHPGARGQGSVTLDSIPGLATTKVGAGLAVFLDTGGEDFYDSSPPGRTSATPATPATPRAPPTPETPETPETPDAPTVLDAPATPSAPATPPGNDWSWTVAGPPSNQATGPAQVLRGLGMDEGRGTAAFALATSALARATAHWLDGTAVAGPLNDTIELRAALHAQGTVLPAGFTIDRAEFYDQGRLLGPANGSADGRTWNRTWNTSALGEDGLPVYPDGRHAVEARLYPRVGTPVGADATGRRAAVDAEPVTALTSLDVDNPPLPRGVSFPANASTSQGPLRLDLRVDRDLEKGCPECIHLAHVRPLANEWDLVEMQDPGWVGANDTTCKGACHPTVQVFRGGDSAYVLWSEPTQGVKPIGYRVFRRDAAGEDDLAGYVDARAPRRDMLGDGVPRHWFVDPNPGGAQGYVVAPLRTPPTGELIQAMPVSMTPLPTLALPGPATGLVAVGVEGVVRLAWNAASGAQDYVVKRSVPGGSPVTLDTVRGTSFTDRTVLPDKVYHYTVTPLSSAGPSALPSRTVAAKASPGHWIDLRLLGAQARLENASLGGAQTHRIEWDLSAVPDGDYVLETLTTDGAGRFAVNRTAVRLDGTAPSTHLHLPAVIGASYVKGGSLVVPFTVVDEGTGAHETHLFARSGSAPWPVRPLTVNASTGVVLVPNPVDGATLQLVLVSTDNVSNLEGVTRPRPWTPTTRDALEDMVADGRVSSHVIDLNAPTGSFEAFRRTLRPGAPLDLSVRVADVGSGVASVAVTVNGTVVPLSRGDGDVWHGQWIASGAGTFQVLADALDRAGNLARMTLGVVVVDDAAPLVEAAWIEFSGGRLIGRAGETATVRVRAADQGAEEGALNVSVDARNASTLETLRLAYDAEAGVYLGELPINRLGATAVVNVTLEVRDLADHVARFPLEVRIDGRPTPLDDLTHVVGRDAIDFAWTTAEPTKARVDYGLSPQMGQRSAVGPRGTQHAVTIAGLLPDSLYYVKVVAIADSGVETVSEILQLRTGAALDVTLPDVGGALYVRGATTVRAEVQRYDGATPTATLTGVLRGPRGAPQVLGSAPAANGAGLLPLDLGGARDGAYTLVVEADDGQWRGQSAPVRVEIDTTPPLLSLPDVDTLAAGATLRVEVQERGSGVDVERIAWTIGDRRCAASLEDDELACVVPTLSADGLVNVTLLVPDRAGNVATLQRAMRVDGAAPVLRNESLRSADGFARLRPGADAVLSVEVHDLSVRRVFADLTALGGAKETPLRLVAGARHELRIPIAPAAREANVSIPIHAVDAAGRAALVHARSAIDETRPEVIESGINATSATEASLYVRLSEPASVTVRAVGLDGDITVELAEPKTAHVVTLTGLKPGQLRAVVSVRDRAGHEATSVVAGTPQIDRRGPTSVGRVLASDLGDGRVSLEWSAARDDVGVEGYRIVRAVAGEQPVTLALSPDTTLVDVVPVGVEVSYTVRAVDYGGNAGDAAQAAVRSTPVPKPREGSVEPPIGGPGLFRFRVVVDDVGDTPPDVVVRVDGVAHPLALDVAGCRGTCSYSALVRVEASTLAAGPHQYQFQVASGPFRPLFPATEPLLGPVVVLDAPAPAVRGLAAATEAPALGAAALVAVLALAAGAVHLLRRSRR